LKLGRYEIVRELGKGAMGIVYLAKDPLIGRLVALKTIRASAHADDEETKEFQQRFVREAQAAGILNHPAIVTVHDIGQDEASGMSFIAMEYVEGQNLKEMLSQGRTLTFDQIGDIIAQVAEGLDFAHAKGIVHRDVKPANIILLDGLRAKITDFGIAKIASGGANLTTTGQFLGTPNYMAPEQIKGAAVDGRTDIFSLGICLYECLTRRKPFGGDSLTSISYKIVHESFPPLAEINPQIPPGYEDVVANCLQKDPAKRYQRGKEMSAAIRTVIRGERPVRSEPVMADETLNTRDRDKLPTIEIPFPEAAPNAEAGSSTQPARAAAAASAKPAPPVKAPKPPKPPKAPKTTKPSGPSGDPFRNTLSNVRALPVWKTPIPAGLFFGIILAIMLGLAAAAATIRHGQVSVPPVDTKAEVRRAREHQLRMEGNRFIQQGRVDDAYTKFEELLKLEPRSPAIGLLVQKLSAIRQQDLISKQQLGLAKAKFDQGVVFFNEKKFSEAIPLFEESFHLNPNFEESANYLKLAQQELQKSEDVKNARRSGPRNPEPPTTGTRATTGTQSTSRIPPVTDTRGASVASSVLTTIFNGPFADGYIQVKVGAQVVAHENLWEEKGRFLLRRKYPRLVNVTKEIPPSNTDVEVWIVVPSLGIQEHKVLRQNFAPGVQHRLLVTYNAQDKRFDYQMN
jgi:serine/threonine protein kinase